MSLKTCAEVAKEFVQETFHGYEPIRYWIKKFQDCPDFPRPKKTKQVWEWRYWEYGSPNVTSALMSEEEAAKHFSGGNALRHEKHSGPFEIEAEE